jgi:hypothetical protein
MTHRVKLHHWTKEGLLEMFTHVFDTHHEAIEFAKQSGAASAKVYNDSGEIIHEVSTAPSQSTYA